MVTTKSKHWYCLFASIGMEVGGTSIMKLSQGWTFPHAQLLGLVIMWAAIGLSYICLSRAIAGIPVGVSFACWEGLGLTSITLCGALFLGEPLTLRRALGLACVLGGALLVNHGTERGTEHGAAAQREQKRRAHNEAAYVPGFAAMKEDL